LGCVPLKGTVIRKINEIAFKKFLKSVDKKIVFKRKNGKKESRIKYGRGKAKRKRNKRWEREKVIVFMP